MMSADDAAYAKIVAEKNDAARRSVFTEAISKRLYELPYNGATLHQIIRRPDVCLALSMDVSLFTQETKKRLFEICLNLTESDSQDRPNSQNVFNRGIDPEGTHDMALISDAPEPCFVKIDYIQSYDEERYPDDITKDCVRIITLATMSEY